MATLEQLLVNLRLALPTATYGQLHRLLMADWPDADLSGTKKTLSKLTKEGLIRARFTAAKAPAAASPPEAPEAESEAHNSWNRLTP